MAKGNAKSAPAPRVKRGKTVAQQIKRDRNIDEARRRFEKLQAKQKLANDLRKQGYTGSDDAVIDKFSVDQANAEAAEWCKAVLAVPKAGDTIRRWLRDRVTMAPLYLKEVIQKFLNRDGANGQRDNSALKATVENALKEHKLAA